MYITTYWGPFTEDFDSSQGDTFLNKTLSFNEAAKYLREAPGFSDAPSWESTHLIDLREAALS